MALATRFRYQPAACRMPRPNLTGFSVTAARVSRSRLQKVLQGQVCLLCAYRVCTGSHADRATQPLSSHFPLTPPPRTDAHSGHAPSGECRTALRANARSLPTPRRVPRRLDGRGACSRQHRSAANARGPESQRCTDKRLTYQVNANVDSGDGVQL
ncbi:hypothetical protein K438DRAFT_324552 [Mycena galopus ATCC 62051]|nr:hypothetical protein K438DRAFT_324552 [Mycena galopus ATCC 62051]